MKKYFPIFILVGCAGLFGLGVFYLFQLRFAAGDVYPEGSSLRADPLGTMALYESLEELPGMTARRDHSMTGKLPDGKGVTYLHLAGRTYDWAVRDKKEWKDINDFLVSGGRLVVAYYPEAGWHFMVTTTPAPGAAPGPNTITNTVTGTNATGFVPVPIVQQRVDYRQSAKRAQLGDRAQGMDEEWGVDFEHVNLVKDDEDVFQPATVHNVSGRQLPMTLGWHSGTVFATNLDSGWRTIYKRGNHPVVIERKFGAGSVVMATDSYFLTNEAMRKDRHADLLAWLLGPNQRIVFDEAHLGILEQGGIAVLVRKYRLHGLVFALVVLAGLFIWKNSVSLVPPDKAEKMTPHIVGKDVTSGFVNLLRRNIRATDVLNVCYTEWTKSMLLGRHYTITGVDQAQVEMEAESAQPARNRDPVGAYRRICAALKYSNRPGSRSPEPETRKES
jgi:hypothetical protein